MMKSAKLEWALDNLDVALELLEEAIKAYPDFPKLVMMKGQIEEQLKNYEEAQNTYNAGVSYQIFRQDIQFLQCNSI